MTCAICVNNMNDGKMKAKCIFRRCQSWGKGVVERDQGEGRGDSDEVPDNHDSVCDKCKEGGGMCCSNRNSVECTRLFLTIHLHNFRLVTVPSQT
jgi:hypothetical protein